MKATTQRQLRAWHLYIGMFMAPMLLLFAVSGAFQVFRLNEEKGWGGTPPSWLVAIGNIHKNQTLAVRKKGPPPPAAATAAAPKPDMPKPDADKGPKGPSPLPLQIFAILCALSLIALNVLGILIALNSPLYRRGSKIALALGVAFPILLLFV